MDEYVDVAEIGAYGGERRFDRGFVGDIARARLGAGEFDGELGGKLRASRHERHGVGVGGEAPRERLTVAGADADHRADWKLALVRHHTTSTRAAS